jgi:hypothetical protein
MLMLSGDVCVDMRQARAHMDAGGWLTCPAHRLVAHADVLLCPMCGYAELQDLLVEQENTPRTADEMGAVDRFANSTRVRTPAVRRDRRTETERLIVARIRQQLVGVPPPPPPRVLPAVQHPPPLLPLPLGKRARLPSFDIVASLRGYVLIEPGKRCSHRCGIYALSVHLRRLYRQLTAKHQQPVDAATAAPLPPRAVIAN